MLYTSSFQRFKDIICNARCMLYQFQKDFDTVNHVKLPVLARVGLI